MKIINYSKLIVLVSFIACTQKDSSEPVRYKVDESASVIEWKGSAPTHFHTGAFKVSGTLIADKKGKISGGDFSIPIASISNFDLQGEEQVELLKHLKSSDFFDLVLYPEAAFHITKVEDYKDESAANIMITGEFTMKGQTHPIRFPAILKNEQHAISAEGSFILNRTKWGMSKYNDPQEGLYILPGIDIKVKISCSKPGV
ncbi:lipid-binding protein [Terrimonas sp.]|uniref:YceI family protein n=1 Tax=Terrimonas sp. TaxID=1914338 RepID=UPI000D5256E2|nr:YceI family protein [Terrimonas sp.]PVD51907.1 lipid-binding protein [Terrimonas sp.]